MTIRIPLPDMVRNREAKIHPYPFHIGLQTLEFMQGSLFYASLVDIASGAYIRQPGGMANLERAFLEQLDSPKTYDDAWKILSRPVNSA
ncbi:MAG: hypothetical protein WBQ69_11750 [Gallionella sp.]